MSGVLDGVLVGAVLAASVGYALCALGPRPLRQRLLSALASALRRLPAVAGLPALTRRLQDAASAGSGSCGGCDSCGSAPAGPAADAGAAPPAGGPARGTPPAEIRVPLSSIGKRR